MFAWPVLQGASGCCSRSGAARPPDDRQPGMSGAVACVSSTCLPAVAAIDDRDALARIVRVEERLQLRRIRVRVDRRTSASAGAVFTLGQAVAEGARTSSRRAEPGQRDVERARPPAATPRRVRCQLTAVVPSGNDAPDVCVHVVVTGAVPPVTVGAANVTACDVAGDAADRDVGGADDLGRRLDGRRRARGRRRRAAAGARSRRAQLRRPRARSARPVAAGIIITL